jgi:uncharacterized phage protein gp47/JayE
MSLVTPSVEQINDNIISQLESSLGQTIPFLPKSFLRVLAKTLAAVFILLYKYAGFMFLQIFVRTASYADTNINGQIINPLVEWGNLVGVSPRGAATQAELLIDVTVENQTGSLPSGTQLLGPNSGVTYVTLSSVLLDAATVQVTVRAVADQVDGGGAGSIGNLEPGDFLNFANPIANVARQTVVDSQVVTGADAEEVEVYRQRIIDRFQKRPQGGAYSDYELWGEEAAGIINVYPYTGDPGQVNLYSEATVESSGSPDGIPTTAQLTAVLNLVNFDENGLASRRNANAFVNSNPITRTGFDVTVTGITGVSDLAQVQADITTAITEYFLSVEPYIPGLSVPPRNDQITRTRISSIAEDIITAANGTFTSAGFNLTGNGGTIPIYVLGEGEKAKLATPITFN